MNAGKSVISGDFLPCFGNTSTLWIAADSHKVVKTSTTLPSMGGATVTSELQP